MKVVHFGNLASTGYNFCRGLRRKGINAILAHRPHILTETPDRYWIYKFEGMFNGRIAESISKGVTFKDADIVHLHYLTALGTMGFNFLYSHKNIVVHGHGRDIRGHKNHTIRRRISMNMALKRAKVLLLSTPDLYDEAQGLHEDIRFIPNPVDTDKYVPVECETYKDRILVWAKAAKNKGTEAIFKVAEMMPEYTFDVVKPDRSYDMYLLEMAPKNVNFMDPIPRDDVQNFLPKYELIIGQLFLGAIGVGDLEVMSCGIPLIVYWDRSYDRHYDKAMPVLSEKRPKKIVQLIRKHFGDKKLGAKGREWVLRNHSIDACANKLIEVYEECLKCGKST